MGKGFPLGGFRTQERYSSAVCPHPRRLPLAKMEEENFPAEEDFPKLGSSVDLQPSAGAGKAQGKSRKQQRKKQRRKKKPQQLILDFPRSSSRDRAFQGVEETLPEVLAAADIGESRAHPCSCFC